jgi:hypothetical protein
MRISSANIRVLILFVDDVEIGTPAILVSLLMALERDSTTRTKRVGEIGSPCFVPLSMRIRSVR